MRHLRELEAADAARVASIATLPHPGVMLIRPELPADQPAIRSVIEAAFADSPHRSGTEAAIVDALRAADALTVSLVAETGGAIVGHVAFSPVVISDGAPGWFGLGPVAVSQERQRQGIGEALIIAGLDRLRDLGASGCVVLGDPDYYGRLGFSVMPSLRYAGAPPEYFQSLTIRGPAPAGEVNYHRGFDAR